MKKIVCGAFGNIYDAKILKSGLMSAADRRECTDECINAVVQHLLSSLEYEHNKQFGYCWAKKDGDGDICLRVYDTSNYKLVPITL